MRGTFIFSNVPAIWDWHYLWTYLFVSIGLWCDYNWVPGARDWVLDSRTFNDHSPIDCQRKSVYFLLMLKKHFIPFGPKDDYSIHYTPYGHKSFPMVTIISYIKKNECKIALVFYIRILKVMNPKKICYFYLWLPVLGWFLLNTSPFVAR